MKNIPYLISILKNISRLLRKISVQAFNLLLSFGSLTIRELKKVRQSKHAFSDTTNEWVSMADLFRSAINVYVKLYISANRTHILYYLVFLGLCNVIKIIFTQILNVKQL